ncbi:MAG TPA: hypothetical protein GXX35_00045 [Thermoanaerobacterales bacterium]|nr:hypothetical protein [Thermoanaerobacterales bacterium]
MSGPDRYILLNHGLGDFSPGGLDIDHKPEITQNGPIATGASIVDHESNYAGPGTPASNFSFPIQPCCDFGFGQSSGKTI